MGNIEEMGKWDIDIQSYEVTRERMNRNGR